ncbi:MAG TPA: sulfur carrier protein ThiS [Gaiellaceae bacterium]|nr:sulfur carrier protein ThiS [Gaiellaceae bacterium]
MNAMTRTVTLNGKAREIEAGTVSGVLAELGLEGGFALVERNGEPVDRAAYSTEEITDGDVLVVARPVAGG